MRDIYKKHFIGVRPGYKTEAIQIQHERKQLYQYAQHIFEDVVESVKSTGLEVTINTLNNGKQVALISNEEEGIGYVQLGAPIPKEHQPWCLQELYVYINSDNLEDPYTLRKRVEAALVYAGSDRRGDLEIPREAEFRKAY